MLNQQFLQQQILQQQILQQQQLIQQQQQQFNNNNKVHQWVNSNYTKPVINKNNNTDFNAISYKNNGIPSSPILHSAHHYSPSGQIQQQQPILNMLNNNNNNNVNGSNAMNLSGDSNNNNNGNEPGTINQNRKYLNIKKH